MLEEAGKQALQEDLQQAAEKENMLLNALMEKERAIEYKKQLTEKNRKEMIKIRESRTWKFTAPIRALIPRYRRRLNEQEVYISELKFELQETKRNLRIIEERLQIEAEKRDNEQLFRMLRQAKASGDMMRFLEQMIQVKQQNKAHFDNAFKYIASLYKNEKAEYRNMIYHKILSALPPDDVPEVIVRTGFGDKPLSLSTASSFQANLTARARQNQLSGTTPEWLLDNKTASYGFMDKLEVKRPWTSDESYTLTNIPHHEGIVIKPVDGSGSRGVYLVHGFHDIIDVKRSKVLNDWEALEVNMKADITSGWVRHDEWSIEELIYENKVTILPARDLKFYCFYGKVGLILEIIRSPELKYCWWTATGERIRTGKYDEDLFRGQGVSQSEMKLASSVSLEIPAPFIRIDFLKGEEGIVFGEFTPKPGNYEAFNEQIDQWLGDLYLDAEVRLLEDFLDGKQFELYNRWSSQ